MEYTKIYNIPASYGVFKLLSRCYNCGERFTISDSDLRRAENALIQGMDGINVVCKSCRQRYTDGLFVEDISDVPDDMPGDSL